MVLVKVEVALEVGGEGQEEGQELTGFTTLMFCSCTLCDTVLELDGTSCVIRYSRGRGHDTSNQAT